MLTFDQRLPGTQIAHTVRAILVGAAPPTTWVESLEGIGFDLTSFYGLTELYGAATVYDPDTPASGDGQPMADSMFRGNIMMKGYLGIAEAAQQAFAIGGLTPGNVAVVEPDGCIKLNDRSKDIIILGGENIASIRIEDVLYGHSAQMLAAAVALPDPMWGGTPCAFFIELKEVAMVSGE